jgi:hypothetical protein
MRTGKRESEMKKILGLITAIGLTAGAAQADIIMSDNFNYTGAVTNQGWIAYSGSDGSITADGSVASIGGGAEDIRRVFSENRDGVPVYAGFTLNVQSLPTSGGEYNWGFIAQTSAMNSRFGFVSEDSGNEFGLTIYGTGTSVLDTSSGYSLNTDYRIVYYFDGVDNHRLWVDPTGSDFATPLLQTTAAPGSVDFTGVFLRQAGAFDNGASDWTADDFIASTTFPEAIPEPGTLMLFIAGLSGLLALRKKLR